MFQPWQAVCTRVGRECCLTKRWCSALASSVAIRTHSSPQSGQRWGSGSAENRKYVRISRFSEQVLSGYGCCYGQHRCSAKMICEWHPVSERHGMLFSVCWGGDGYERMLLFRTRFLRGHTNTQFTTVRAAVGEWFGGEDVVTMVAAVQHRAKSLSAAGCGYSLQQDGRCVKGNDSTGKRLLMRKRTTTGSGGCTRQPQLSTDAFVPHSLPPWPYEHTVHHRPGSGGGVVRGRIGSMIGFLISLDKYQ
jgi:hypothetical protein